MINDSGIFSQLRWYWENDKYEMADIWGLEYYEEYFGKKHKL